MTNKNPTAWEYDHDKERGCHKKHEYRYKVIQSLHIGGFRHPVRDDPEHDKVSV